MPFFNIECDDKSICIILSFGHTLIIDDIKCQQLRLINSEFVLFKLSYSVPLLYSITICHTLSHRNLDEFDVCIEYCFIDIQ